MTDVTGWEAYKPDGTKIADQTQYMSLIVGLFITNGSVSGSFTDPKMVGRRIIPFVINNMSRYGGPKVTLNSATGKVTWEYTIEGSQIPSPPVETVLYGAY